MYHYCTLMILLLSHPRKFLSKTQVCELCKESCITFVKNFHNAVAKSHVLFMLQTHRKTVSNKGLFYSWDAKCCLNWVCQPFGFCRILMGPQELRINAMWFCRYVFSFVSTLVTAVLTHHLGWVATVLPGKMTPHHITKKPCTVQLVSALSNFWSIDHIS